jgi:hypothetical protein
MVVHRLTYYRKKARKSFICFSGLYHLIATDILFCICIGDRADLSFACDLSEFA